MSSKKIFIAIVFASAIIPSLICMQPDAMKETNALARQVTFNRYRDENREIQALSYDERLRVLQKRFSSMVEKLKDLERHGWSIDRINILEMYNSLRVLWDQEPAASLDDIDYRWLLQQAYLVNNNQLLESLEPQKVADYVAGITAACEQLAQPELAPLAIEACEKEALFKYNNLRQLSRLTQARSLGELSADWLRQLMQDFVVPVQHIIPAPIVAPQQQVVAAPIYQKALEDNVLFRQTLKWSNRIAIAPAASLCLLLASNAVIDYDTAQKLNLMFLYSARLAGLNYKLLNRLTPPIQDRIKAITLFLVFGLSYQVYTTLSERYAGSLAKCLRTVAKSVYSGQQHLAELETFDSEKKQ